MKSAITELFGIEHPIIQGGMQWVGRAELTAAVSNAGGLGILTALTQPTPDDLAREIARCRSLTDRPFGVNLALLPSATPPPYDAYIDAIIAGGVKIIETAGRSPGAYVERLHAAGVRILHKCTSVRHALSAERAGVDVVGIDGFECAGHPGDDDVPGLVLIPAAVDALSIPVVASGGIADGRGMAAALSLGAEGVIMGTRFMVTQEAPIHDGIKQRLVAARETDTGLIMRTLQNTGRVLRNGVSAQVLEIERRPDGCSYEDVRDLVAGARGRRGLESGDPEAGLVWAGMSVGLVQDIPTCAELIERIVADCRASLDRARRIAG